MSFSNELATERFFQNVPETETPDVVSPPPTARRSWMSLFNNIMVFTVLAISAAVVGIWWQQPAGKTKSKNPAADLVLWITGSNMNWDEYQQRQQKAGNPRMDEKEYDWMQQMVNDAYSAR